MKGKLRSHGGLCGFQSQEAEYRPPNTMFIILSTLKKRAWDVGWGFRVSGFKLQRFPVDVRVSGLGYEDRGCNNLLSPVSGVHVHPGQKNLKEQQSFLTGQGCVHESEAVMDALG